MANEYKTLRNWDRKHGAENIASIKAFVNCGIDSYAVLRLKSAKEIQNEQFQDLDWLERHGKKPEFSHYHMIDTGILRTQETVAYSDTGPISRNIPAEELLETLRGRYYEDLFTSDIVALQVNSQISFHFFDERHGFQELQNFLPEEYRKPSVLKQLKDTEPQAAKAKPVKIGEVVL